MDAYQMLPISIPEHDRHNEEGDNYGEHGAGHGKEREISDTSQPILADTIPRATKRPNPFAPSSRSSEPSRRSKRHRPDFVPIFLGAKGEIKLLPG